MHHWPAFSFASPTPADDDSFAFAQDRPMALVGHDARFMVVPRASAAAPAIALGADEERREPAAPSNWKPYAFGIAYVVFAVSTAGASFFLLAASIRPH